MQLPSKLIATPLSSSVIYLAFQLGVQLGPHIESLLAQFGLTGRTYHILELVIANQGSSQREVADQLGIDPTPVVAAVDYLESSGLLERRRSAADRRRYDLRATRSGTALAGRARAAAAQLEDRLLMGLDEGERAAFKDGLQTLFDSTEAPVVPSQLS
ncbi:MarR family winged helix-turn-helix transcriptional regulator [Nocardia sp. SYP-A9097]|uniref:MarR family winged helix-turn-helix transcriptional regulator n=1 Tax=Nocardia sp. SYP-A9097 TaxID=2663237 RepID=UPI0028151D79|nr:MarR family winged helix-turn-helix transcriptional regulator [Nocardia sp. SYP-A9097]